MDLFSELTGKSADLYSAISEGTMIATVRENKAAEALKLLRGEGIKAGVIGRVTGDRYVFIKRKDGSEEKVTRPVQDPFWPIFFKAANLTEEAVK